MNEQKPANISNQPLNLGEYPDYDDPAELADLSPAQQREMDHIMDTEGLSAYEARLRALGGHVTGKTVELDTATDEEDLPEIDRPERFNTIKQKHGFFVTSLRELSEVTTIDAFAQRPGGVAKHLAEIARHQVKYEADPVRATTAVATEYADNAQQARSEMTHLRQLSDELAEIDAHPFAALDPVLAVTRPGLLVRFLDWEDFAQRQPDDEIYPLVRYTDQVAINPREYSHQNPHKPMRDHINARLAGLRVDQAKKAVRRAIADRQSAKQYWTSQLEVIEQHSTREPRLVAMQALNKLEARPRT